MGNYYEIEEENIILFWRKLMSNSTIVDGRKCKRCFTRVRTQYLTNGLCRGCYSDVHRMKPERESRSKIDPDLLKIVKQMKL